MCLNLNELDTLNPLLLCNAPSDGVDLGELGGPCMTSSLNLFCHERLCSGLEVRHLVIVVLNAPPPSNIAFFLHQRINKINEKNKMCIIRIFHGTTNSKAHNLIIKFHRENSSININFGFLGFKELSS